MHILLKRQILRGGQRHTRRGDTLDGGVVRKVGEYDRAVDGAGAAELLNEVFGFLERDADGGEHDSEVLTVAEHLRLTRDLRGERRVGQSGAGEDGQLLAADEGVQSVNGGNAGLDELGGVSAGGGVHGKTVDVAVLLGDDGRAFVDRLAHAVEDTAEHILAHAELERMAEEADLALGKVDALRRLEELHDRAVALNFEHLAAPDAAVRQLDLRQLVVGDAIDVLHDHQRAGDLLNCLIFADHCSSPPRTTSSISDCISSRMPS